MSAETQFAEVLNQAFFTEDNSLRQEKELLISKFIQEEPENFVQLTIKVIRGSFPPNIRMVGGTVLATAFKLRNHEDCPMIWRQLSPLSQDAVKGVAIDMMIDENPQIRKSGSNLTALIFILDLISAKRWNEIVKGICSNIQNSEQKFKQSAINTLSGICEKLSPARMQCLDQDSRDVLMGGICNSLKLRDENAQTAVKAFNDSIPCLAAQMENKEFLTFIFEQLIEFADLSLQKKNLDLVTETIKCLTKTIKYCYHNFEMYHRAIFDKVLQCEQTNDPKVRSLVFEFFIRCFKFEEKHKMGFFENYWGPLLQLCMQRLFESISFDSSEIEEVINSIDTILNLMTLINKFYGAQSFPKMSQFVQQHLQGTDEKSKVCAVIIVASLVETPVQPVFKDFFNFALVNLLEISKNGATFLHKIVAADCIEKITTNHFNLIAGKDELHKFCSDLNEILTTHDDSEASIQIKILVCHCFDAFTVWAKKNGEIRKLLSDLVPGIFTMFFNVFKYTANLHLIDLIFTNIFAFCEQVLEYDQLKAYFPVMVDMLKSTYDHYKGENKQLIMESIQITMNVCLTMCNMHSSPAKLSQQDIEYFANLFRFIGSLMDQNGAICTEGVLLMTTILNQSHEFFEQAVPELYNRYIKKGLSETNDINLMSSSITSFLHIYRIYPDKFKQDMKDFIEYILMMFQKPTFPQEMKISVYSFISEMLTFQPEIFAGKMSDLFKMNIQALEAVLHFTKIQSDEEEENIYWTKLRDAVIENVLCMIHGFYLVPGNQYDYVFGEFFSKLQSLIRELLNSEVHRTGYFLKMSLSNLLDFYTKNKRMDESQKRLYVTLLEQVRLLPQDEERDELFERIRTNNLPLNIN